MSPIDDIIDMSPIADIKDRMYIRNARDLGLLIRQRRRHLKLDQRELARQVGVGREWIIETEKGKPRAAVGLVLRTLATLGLVLDVREDRVPGPGKGKAKAIDIDAIVDAARTPRS